MSHEIRDQPNGDGEDHPGSPLLSNNGYPPTPALSPIDEGEADGIDGRLDRDSKDRKPAHDTRDSTPVPDGSVKLPQPLNNGSASLPTNGAVPPTTPRLPNGDAAVALKLSPQKLRDLVTSQDSLPIRAATPPLEEVPSFSNGLGITGASLAAPDHGSGPLPPPEELTLPPLASISATPGAVTPSAIKLYVIYNVLEVFDRLFSALGQDILECLFSKETLERNEKGRSKLLRPFWLWVLALVYVVIHSTALFYQVVTLNVAVNSYSNALLTLLMSNQFVEIKGTVFKKFEKENLFQLTCADIVERFQLWLMLLIIAVRNIVEVGGLSISLTSALGGAGTPTESLGANATGLPLTSGFVIPNAFTLLPKWTGEVLGPFLIVLGSEALVDWCKHAYIGKFNNVKPVIYDRFLDVLAKDYYSHAFVDQNLTKRLGLPVIPLSCLFIRACMQTYHMFLAAHLPPPIPSMGTAVSLDTDATTTSPATTAALQHIDHVFRRALGRSTFGAGSDAGGSFSWWSIDDLIAFGTMITVFLALFLILLAFKLLLGMLLLSYARNRCSGIEERERQVTVAVDGKRAGIGALTEVDEAKRRWIYQDDPDGLKVLREKEERGRKQNREKGDKLEGVDRYMMAAKRIW
ncbi:hypothetical protein B0A55_03022 [Friedmanniomyces simplex]|uniref:Eukaryotic membrane protein family n=1 Tax=Friedmanniomyces simplex TaxID=329884 RepID=A0A4U0XUU9_9PEZI|nr:hypothetical protein B0A55_03022 [Friedmanniomyces simplex]